MATLFVENVVFIQERLYLHSKKKHFQALSSIKNSMFIWPFNYFAHINTRV